MKKKICVLLFTAIIAVTGIQSCKKNDNDPTNLTPVSHNEDASSLNAMTEALSKMGVYNDSLANAHNIHHQLHHDSLFHHHDSIFWHHHHVYHHGDTTHHHNNHGHHHGHHHHLDSIHHAHGPHHP